MDYRLSLTTGHLTLSARSSLSQEHILQRRFDKLVLLLHGFPDNNETFTELYPLLQKKYTRALFVAPALRGYESNSLGGSKDYCMYEVATDIKNWINTLADGKNIPVHIVGHDWGAIVAFKTASMYPDLVTSMVTLAIPYLTNLSLLKIILFSPLLLFKQIWLLSYMLTMQIKFLYHYKFGGDYLHDLWRFWSPTWNFSDTQLASVAATLSNPFVLDGATAYYRCLLTPKNWKSFRWYVNFDEVPTLILGGTEDGCMLAQLFRLEQKVLATEAKACVALIENVGHFMHRENPLAVASHVISWLAEHP